MRFDAMLVAHEVNAQATAASMITAAVQIQAADRGASRLQRRINGV